MRKVLIVVTIVTIILCYSTCAFATGFTPGDYIPDSGSNTTVEKIGNKIIGIFQIIGSIVAVASLLFMGIRLMLASPGERANVKGHSIPYIVGAVMLFSIVNLLAIVSQIMSNVAP